MPRRLQCTAAPRTRRPQLPPGAVYVGRPTLFGNPFIVRTGKALDKGAPAKVAMGSFCLRCTTGLDRHNSAFGGWRPRATAFASIETSEAFYPIGHRREVVEAHKAWLLYPIAKPGRSPEDPLDPEFIERHGRPAPCYHWAQMVLDEIGQLRGKDLACWCPEGGPCHADILLELANR